MRAPIGVVFCSAFPGLDEKASRFSITSIFVSSQFLVGNWIGVFVTRGYGNTVTVGKFGFVWDFGDW